jgi:hypothetical protein
MSKLTFDQIKVLFELTGKDYGVNGALLKVQRTIKQRYLLGVYSVYDIYKLEKEYEYPEYVQHLNFEEWQKMYCKLERLSVVI